MLHFNRENPRQASVREEAERKLKEEQRVRRDFARNVLREYKRLHRHVLKYIDGSPVEFEKAHAELVEFEENWGLRDAEANND